MSIYCTTTGRFLQQGYKVRDRLFIFAFVMTLMKTHFFGCLHHSHFLYYGAKFTASTAVPSQGKQFTQSRLLSRAGWVQRSGNLASGLVLNGRNVVLIVCCWLLTILLTSLLFHSSWSFLPIFVSSDPPMGILWWLIVRLERNLALIPLPLLTKIYKANLTRSLLSPSFPAVFLFLLVSPLCCWFLCPMDAPSPLFPAPPFPFPCSYSRLLFNFFLSWLLSCSFCSSGFLRLPLFSTSVALFLPPCCFFLFIPSVYCFISFPLYYHWFNSFFVVVVDCHVLFSCAWHWLIPTTMDTCVATMDTSVATIDTCVATIDTCLK